MSTTAIVVEGGGITLLNANDAAIAGWPLGHLLARHGPIDFAFRTIRRPTPACAGGSKATPAAWSTIARTACTRSWSSWTWFAAGDAAGSRWLRGTGAAEPERFDLAPETPCDDMPATLRACRPARLGAIVKRGA